MLYPTKKNSYLSTQRSLLIYHGRLTKVVFVSHPSECETNSLVKAKVKFIVHLYFLKHTVLGSVREEILRIRTQCLKNKNILTVIQR